MALGFWAVFLCLVSLFPHPAQAFNHDVAVRADSAEQSSEKVAVIVWNINDKRNTFGPKPGQIDDIFKNKAAIIGLDDFIELSKSSLPSLKKHGLTSASNHGLEALREIIRNLKAKNPKPTKLRLMIFVDAHGYRCEDEKPGGICTDLDCKISYPEMLETLVGKTGEIKTSDDVEVEVFLSACYSAQANRELNKFFNVTRVKQDGSFLNPTHRLSLYSTSKDEGSQTWSSDLWDTMQLAMKIGRESPMSADEFTEALLILGVEDLKDQALRIRRHSMHRPNSDHVPLPLDPFVKLTRRGLQKLTDEADRNELVERLNELLNRQNYLFGLYGDRYLFNPKSSFEIANQFLDAALAHPTDRKGAMETLGKIAWEPLVEAISERLHRTKRMPEKELLLHALGQTREGRIYQADSLAQSLIAHLADEEPKATKVSAEVLSQFQFTEPMVKSLVPHLNSQNAARRVTAAQLLGRASKNALSSSWPEIAPRLTDPDPKVRASLTSLGAWTMSVPCDEFLRLFAKEKESEVRRTAAAGIAYRLRDGEWCSPDDATKLFELLGRDVDPAVGLEVFRGPFGNEEAKWKLFADWLERALPEFDDMYFFGLGTNLKDFAIPQGFEDKRTFWRIYNFVSELAYQRKGKMTEYWRKSTVELRQKMDAQLKLGL